MLRQLDSAFKGVIMASNEITGRAKKFDGTPIDYVSIFNWHDGKCIAQVKPDHIGNWRYIYTKNLKIGVTYVADGCEPITHGAYEFTYPNISKKWWRVKNIKHRIDKPESNLRSVAVLNFLNTEGVKCDQPSRGFSNSSYTAAYTADKAFDGNNSTWANSAVSTSQVTSGIGWHIGYQFNTPVTVTAVQIQVPGSLTESSGQEWQTADVEYSNDGVTWVKYGVIEPRVANMDLSLITTFIIID